MRRIVPATHQLFFTLHLVFGLPRRRRPPLHLLPSYHILYCTTLIFNTLLAENNPPDRPPASFLTSRIYTSTSFLPATSTQHIIRYTYISFASKQQWSDVRILFPRTWAKVAGV